MIKTSSIVGYGDRPRLNRHGRTAEGRWHADVWPRGGDYLVEVQAADASNWRIECEVPVKMPSRSASGEGGVLALMPL